MQADVDYIVIGAGSAGCVVANRLSEESDKVVILEAGGMDDNYKLRVPAAALQLRGDDRFDWKFQTDRTPHVANRTLAWTRGRVLGGSSSVNGMNFVRGLPSDFDEWEELGCDGWSFKDVLPYFKSMERFDEGSDEFRGRNGPLRVEPYRTILPMTHKMVEAIQQSGFKLFPDLNAGSGEGVGYSQMSRDGRWRHSSARAFLRPVLGRANLKLEIRAFAQRLIFEGKRCVGVVYLQDGVEKTLRARKEVIVSCGSIGSPHLLQVSGVGSAEHLKSIGVEVVHNLPGVGENLNDHYAATVGERIDGILTLNDYVGSWRLIPSAIQWALFSKGPFTFGGTTATTYAKSRPDLAHPDLQFLFLPGLFSRGSTSKDELVGIGTIKGVRFSISAAKPKSRGRLRAKSADIKQHPSIDPGYLTAPEDMETLKSGIGIVRRILKAPALAPFIRGELYPGPKVQSDSELEHFIRTTGHTAYHPAGTCKMGKDRMAVVDPTLRVYGIEGLRVVDASVMPIVTSGNINAPTTMIGEKASAIIKSGAKAVARLEAAE